MVVLLLSACQSSDKPMKKAKDDRGWTIWPPDEKELFRLGQTFPLDIQTETGRKLVTLDKGVPAIVCFLSIRYEAWKQEADRFAELRARCRSDFNFVIVSPNHADVPHFTPKQLENVRLFTDADDYAKNIGVNYFPRYLFFDENGKFVDIEGVAGDGENWRSIVRRLQDQKIE